MPFNFDEYNSKKNNQDLEQNLTGEKLENSSELEIPQEENTPVQVQEQPEFSTIEIAPEEEPVELGENLPQQENEQETSDFITQSAISIADKFKESIEVLGLNNLSALLNPQDAQLIMNNIIDKTLNNVNQQLGA